VLADALSVLDPAWEPKEYRDIYVPLRRRYPKRKEE
jgi:hypothetical protein